MKVVIEDAKMPTKIKEGDLIKYNGNGDIYIITSSIKGYQVINLNCGSTNGIIYESIVELLESEFGYPDEYTVYTSNNYFLNLIKN